MSEQQRPEFAPTSFLPHVISQLYQEIRPAGYLFSEEAGHVKLTYYRDETRITNEFTTEDGKIHYETLVVRVEDASVILDIEQFVRLSMLNLQSIASSKPELLRKYGVTVSA